MKNLKIFELTNENEDKYLDKLAELEEIVLKHMNENGKKGQLFITGKEDLAKYVHSKDNTIMIAVDEEDEVCSATYITQNQIPFTYNDITKYFKYGNRYQEYVKKSYEYEHDFKKDVLMVYALKLDAFKYAKEKILSDNPEYNGDIIEYLNSELNEENNEFHEKSKLREDLNMYMSEYVHNLDPNGKKNLEQKYEKFYWITADYVAKVFKKQVQTDNPRIKFYENYMKKEQEEYREILDNGPLYILEESKCDESKYYGANTKNSVEIDTYITHPNKRSDGVARALVYEGIKKHIERHFNDEKNKEIYLCSTLHRDNLSSKYVSEFFGLKDNLYVQRRNGRNREVHICKIERNQYKEYLDEMQDKLIVFYGYNPEGKKLTNKRKVELLRLQLQYEEKEIKRLIRTKMLNQKFTGQSLQGISSKKEKIKNIYDLIERYSHSKDKGDDNEPEL